MPPSNNTTLLHAEENIYIGDWSISQDDLNLGIGDKWSVKKYTLHGGKQAGVEVIEVDNGALTFSVVPTRGMSIYQVHHQDIVLGWNSPVTELVHPQFINLEKNGGLGWLEGFNEWMTRCGVEFAGHPGQDNGRLLTLHGKIGNIPASEVQVIIDDAPPHRIRIRGRVHEHWFNGPQLELWTEISTEIGSHAFRIDDALTNRSHKDQEITIIYHANFGPPILEKGSQLHGTIGKVVPFDDFAAKDVSQWNIYGEPKDNYPEKVYCLYPTADANGMSHFLLHNAAGDKAIGFQMHTDQLPYMTQWKNENSDGYVTGLEPGTGFPHNRSVERKYGRVPVIKPGESRNFGLEYTIHSGKEAVSAQITNIERINPSSPEVVATVIDK